MDIHAKWSVLASESHFKIYGFPVTIVRENLTDETVGYHIFELYNLSERKLALSCWLINNNIKIMQYELLRRWCNS